jgi:hypothetical protein
MQTTATCVVSLSDAVAFPDSPRGLALAEPVNAAIATKAQDAIKDFIVRAPLSRGLLDRETQRAAGGHVPIILFLNICSRWPTARAPSEIRFGRHRIAGLR